MAGINPALPVTSIFIDQQPDGQRLAVGEIVNGFVLGKSNYGTRVMIEGRETLVAPSIFVVESKGETAKFEIVKSNGAELALRYMRPDEGVGPISDAGFQMKPTKITNGYQQMIDQSIKHLNAEDTLKVNGMVKNAQMAIESIINTMTEPDITQMMQDGMKPEKVSVELIAQVLKHNKPLVKAQQMEAIETQVTREVAKLKATYEDEVRLTAVATALKKANLPINKRHVDQLLNALNTVDEIKSMTQREAMQLVQSEKSIKEVPTIEQVYKALHSPMPEMKVLTIEDPELGKMVIDHMNKEGIPVTKESIDMAKAMVQRGVSITPERLAFILAPRETMEKVQPMALIEAMVEKLETNQSATKAQIVELSVVSDVTPQSTAQGGTSVSKIRREQLTVTIDLVSKMTSAQVARAVLTNRYANLNQVAEVVEEDQIFSKDNEPQIKIDATQVKDTFVSETSSAREVEKALNFRKQLSEIRLKMTLEVAVRLEKQGVKVDTAPIEQVVRALEAEEIDLRRNQLLAYSDTSSKPMDLQTIDLMNQTMHHVKQLGVLQDEVAGVVVNNSISYTLSNLTELAFNLEAQETEAAVREAMGEPEVLKSRQVDTLLALNNYEASMTQIRPDLGDRIERTYEQIAPILKEMGLPVTDTNTRAVEILAKNEMAITEAKILEVQVTQEKIDLVTEKMTPAVVVKMIQSGINPVALKIDELMAFITVYEEENALTESVKISELIHDMDRGAELTDEERRSLMAIYRTFDTVVRSKGAATGFMVKRSLPLTIDGLFEAAKYIRRTGYTAGSIQVAVDDTYGVLEDVANKEASIREQVKSAMNELGSKGLAAAESDVETLIKEGISVNPVNMLKKQLMDLRVMSFIRALGSDSGHNVMKAAHGQPIEALPIEEVTELINQHARNETMAKNTAFQEIQKEAYLTFIKANPELLRSMLSHKIPLTFENFSKAVAMEKDTFVLMKDLETMIKGIGDVEMKDKAVQHLTNAAGKVLEGKASYDQLKAAMEDVEAMIRGTLRPEAPEVYRSSQSVKATMSHTQMIQITEDYYQIPVFIEDQLTQLNLYILNDKVQKDQNDGDMQVLMSFSAGSLGKVQALMSIKGNQAEIQLQSSDQDDRPLLKKYEGDFTKVIAETNYTLTGFRYEAFELPEPVEVKKKPSPMNKKFDASDGHIDWSI